jgi:hypothetical protein
MRPHTSVPASINQDGTETVSLALRANVMHGVFHKYTAAALGQSSKKRADAKRFTGLIRSHSFLYSVFQMLHHSTRDEEETREGERGSSHYARRPLPNLVS